MWPGEDDEQVPHVTAKLPPRLDRAFVAMPRGGVLAVGGCEDRVPNDKAEAVACGLECARGCPPALPDDEAWWLEPDGTEQQLSGALEGILAPRPILLPGSDGSPLLVAARASDPRTPRLFRFNPWAQTFVEADVPTGLRLPRPGHAQPIAIDPDAFVWIDESDQHGELFGLRLGTRNRYTQDLALVLLSDPSDPTRPLHLVPDRPLRRELDEKYNGRLWLVPHEPRVTVAVADTDYGDVTVRVKLAEPSAASGIDESFPPVVVLGEVELGGEACPWVEANPAVGESVNEKLRRLTEQSGVSIPSIVRRGTRAELQYAGERRTCTVPQGRLSLALRAGSGRSVIAELEVLRGAIE
jgi:hypothetical protein